MSGLSFKSRVPTFDANIGVGHRKDRAYPYDGPEQLLAEMNRHGVDRAVVYACEGELVSAIRGNESVARWTEGNSGLVPQQVIGPDADSLRHIEELHAAGLVSSVRFHSTEMSRLPFVQWVYGDALSWLVDQGIPLWMSLADTPSTEVVETLQHYPNLRLVLVGGHYSHSLVLRPMLRVLPHAVLELSRYENLRGIERLVDEIGAERLIYGTYFPRYAMGPMLYMLNQLSIDEKDLAAICAGNLERILEKA